MFWILSAKLQPFHVFLATEIYTALCWNILVCEQWECTGKEWLFGILVYYWFCYSEEVEEAQRSTIDSNFPKLGL